MPNIVSLSDGGFVIGWESMNQDGNDWGIFAQLFDQRGLKVGSEFRVNSYKRGKQMLPNISKLGGGGFVIVWNGEGKYGSGVYSKTYDKIGKPIGSDYLVKSGSTRNTRICDFSNGNFLVSYQDGDGLKGKYYLHTPINHTLISFELLQPEYDATLNTFDPKFIWDHATEAQMNFPYEVTYDLYIDTDQLLLNPIIEYDIQDTSFQINFLAPGKTYFWKVLARNFSGDSLWSSEVYGFYIDQNATEVEVTNLLPKDFCVEQNYPNPFNPSTIIKYSIPEQSIVSIIVYDVLGRLVKVLVDSNQQPGNYSVEFNTKELGNGIYFYTVQAGKFSETKKMILMK